MFHFIVRDCLFLLDQLVYVYVSFYRRFAKQAAHVLAREVGSLSGIHSSGIDPPSFLYAALAANALV